MNSKILYAVVVVGIAWFEASGQLVPVPRIDDVHRVARVVNGQPASPNSYPWQASLLLTVNGNGVLFCGGILVAIDYVLTAAHCVDGITAKRVKVGLGDHIFNEEEGTEQIISVSRITISSSYDADTFDSDYALVKLKTGATLNNYVQIANLGNVYKADGDCVVTGWGTSDPNLSSMTPVLQEATVDVMSNADCADIWQHVSPITDNMMCAGSTTSGSCTGDSGGPLMCLENGNWVVHGIVSWGASACGIDGVPDVYTRISAVYKNIMSITSKASNSNGNGKGHKGKRSLIIRNIFGGA
uniref:Elastase-like protein 026 n=1 Tax=Saccoglossus kowalevskii TaxID=10224 RepID=A0A1L7H7Q2_SACKO|nr:elastase-like protein 026 [Saccoglossus kowalevskii]